MQYHSTSDASKRWDSDRVVPARGRVRSAPPVVAHTGEAPRLAFRVAYLFFTHPAASPTRRWVQ